METLKEHKSQITDLVKSNDEANWNLALELLKGQLNDEQEAKNYLADVMMENSTDNINLYYKIDLFIRTVLY